MNPLLALLVATEPAAAFCGTYVGAADAQLYNNVSQIAVARQGSRTTLTLANDYQGDATEFAVVVPVPHAIEADQVALVDPEVFDRLDAYSAPRLVSYTCDELHAPQNDTADLDAADTGAAGAGADADGAVTVDASFSLGSYDFVSVTAQDAAALIDWMNTNGYAISPEAESLLGEYIDGGSGFFAGKVSLDALAKDTSYLEPFRFTYESEIFSLPIRLGTLNSQGSQDLILYALTDYADGQVRISNYPEVTPEDECLWREEEWGDFGTFYESRFAQAVDAEARPGWAVEYGWGFGSCDPCSGEPPTGDDLVELGFEGAQPSDTGTGGTEFYFTRIHTRYTPEGADQELVLYTSNDTSNTQIRYVLHAAELESDFPVCGEGFVEDGGACEDETSDDTGEGTSAQPTDTEPPAVDAEPQCACAAGPAGPAGGLFVLAFAGLRRSQGIRKSK